MTARVLVVDDILPNLKLLEARLNAEYFDVLTATNGADAIAICEQGQCDIVLLDVMMPGMDGFEVCRRLEEPDRDRAPADRPRHRARPAGGPRARPRSRRRRFPHQADRRGLADRAGPFAGPPQGGDRRIAQSRQHHRRAGHDRALRDAQRRRRPARPHPDRRRPRQFRRAPGPGARRPHHNVHVEPDAHEALFKAAEDNVDLIIVSLGLSGYDGLQAVQPDPLARAHAQPAHPASSPTSRIVSACCAASISASTTA